MKKQQTKFQKHFSEIQKHQCNQCLKHIRKELKQNIDQTYKEGSIKFFKEKINPIGVRAPIVKKIAKKYFKEVKDLSKKDFFLISEKLLDKKTMEETLIAFNWLRKRQKELTKSDFPRLERWLKKYVDNWAFCDDFCTHALGYLVNTYPELVLKTKKWTKSKNRWLRRASAVVLIYPWTKPNPFLKEIFEIADILLLDPDDLVQKGYGWMLKVAADHYPEKVFQFVLKRKHKMPRTALRYAIEKFPKEMKREAMKK